MSSNSPDPKENWHLYSEADKDLTPWVLQFVRSMYAEHNSHLFDVTPMGAIDTIVSLTLYALHNMSPTDDDAGDAPTPS